MILSLDRSDESCPNQQIEIFDSCTATDALLRYIKQWLFVKNFYQSDVKLPENMYSSKRFGAANSRVSIFSFLTNQSSNG